MSATAALTSTLVRRYTSAACGIAQSTTDTMTTPGSTGGGSARQSPTCRSIHFLTCGPCAATDVAVVSATALVAKALVVGGTVSAPPHAVSITSAARQPAAARQESSKAFIGCCQLCLTPRE